MRTLAPGRGSFAQVAGYLAVSAALCCGCATDRLAKARANFYLGRFDQAEACINDGDIPQKDRLLYLMERGMVRQNQGKYDSSSRDWIAAAAVVEDLETYSISKGAASMVINDNVQDFCGFPFERCLMHAFTAKNFMAEGKWDDAAVEGRLILKAVAPERRGTYPDDAYSRYVAGFTFEMLDDPSNAALEYRNAQKLVKNLVIGKDGRISAESGGAAAGKDDARNESAELVCFIATGRVPARRELRHGMWNLNESIYGEIYHNGKRLGRSYVLADTAELSEVSEDIDAARQALKTVSRVIVKETVAVSLERKNRLLGCIARLVLIGFMEQPDLRKWGTLPRWLSVARVECPPDMQSFDVVFKRSGGSVVSSIHVEKPIVRKGKTFVSFCRDIKDVSKP